MKHKATLILVISVLLFVFIAGCTSIDGSSNKSHTAPTDNGPTLTPTPVATATPEPTLAPEPAPISFSGSTGEHLEQFRLERGMAVFTIYHPTSGNCKIWLSNRKEKIRLLLDTTDGYYGRTAEGITVPDDYYLEVAADNVWSVQIDQPRPISAQSVPITFTGKGQQVTELFALDTGQTTFNVFHDGGLGLAIRLVNVDGTEVGLLPDGSGAFDGSVIINVTKVGIYLLDIKADGNWRVGITQ